MFSRTPTTGPEAAKKINFELAKAAKRAGAEARTLSDLRKAETGYPELVPVLLEWLREFDTRTALADVASGNIHDSLFRALITPDAPAAEVFALAVGYLDSQPPIAGTVLQGASICAGYHAGSGDRDTMIRLAKDRVNGSGRVWILEWLVKSRDPEAIDAAMGELDDDTVAPLTLRELAKLRTWPDGLRARVEPLVDSDHKETVKNARRLLTKLDKAG